MVRGTTPTHTFTLPFDSALIKTVKIIYAQADNVILEKKSEDCTFKGNAVMVTLTQEDTLRFEYRKINAQIQVRVLTLGGDSLVSDIASVPVGKLLDNEVLV